jgi:hypothetical protein
MTSELNEVRRQMDRDEQVRIDVMMRDPRKGDTVWFDGLRRYYVVTRVTPEIVYTERHDTDDKTRKVKMPLVVWRDLVRYGHRVTEGEL